MFFIIGFVVVLGSVLGGYVLANGHLAVLWQAVGVNQHEVAAELARRAGPR